MRKSYVSVFAAILLLIVFAFADQPVQAAAYVNVSIGSGYNSGYYGGSGYGNYASPAYGVGYGSGYYGGSSYSRPSYPVASAYCAPPRPTYCPPVQTAVCYVPIVVPVRPQVYCQPSAAYCPPRQTYCPPIYARAYVPRQQYASSSGYSYYQGAAVPSYNGYNRY